MKYAYGVHHQNDIYKDQAIELLESIPSESNAILKKWEQVGLSSQNAASSQSLLHLKKNHCNKKQEKLFTQLSTDPINLFFPNKQLFMESIRCCLTDAKTLVVKKTLDFLINFVSIEDKRVL